VARELARGNVADVRARLRALGRSPDASVAYEATALLAQTYDDPREQLSVWDDASSTLEQGNYRALVERERQRLRARLRARRDSGAD
jgi:hypothetical protein